MRIKKTERGFRRGEFKDQMGAECSIQESSLATGACLWLGMDRDHNGKEVGAMHLGQHLGARMHLTQKQAGTLARLLAHFAEHGELPGRTSPSRPRGVGR